MRSKPETKERTMTSNNQTQTQEQSYTYSYSSLAIATVDAYETAHDAVSDLSAIFETLDTLTLAGLNNDRISRMLTLAGIRHAADRLKMLDAKIIDANETLDDLRDD
jgi:hypothetical protein